MEKIQKIILVVKTFLAHTTYTPEELEKLPELKGFSKEEIEEYLKDPFIINLYGFDRYNNIQKWLNDNISKSKEKNKVVKDDDSSKHIKKSESEMKTKQMLAFTYMYLSYPMSFQEIADFYNKTNLYGEVVDANYVSNCLRSKQNYDELLNNLWYQVSDKLERRKNQNDLVEAVLNNKSSKK